MAALDQIIVAALIALPQSYLLWFHSREFDAPLVSRVWIYLLPGLLVAARWALTPRRPRLRTDAAVVGLFAAITAVGLLNALLRTWYPLNVLSAYVQQLYWMALAVAFLVTVADREPTYLLTLIRRYYLGVAAIGVIYVALAFVLGPSLPHTAVTLPGGQYVTANYYVSLAFPEHGLLQMSVARYTFLYREPKVLALHLVIGLMLQIAWLWRAWNGPARLQAAAGLAVVLAGFLLANSVFAYLVGLVLAGLWLPAPWLRRRGWRGFRAIALTAAGIGVPLFVAALLALGQSRGAMHDLATASGKHINAVRGYVQAIPRTVLAVRPFPLGTGSMNLDSPRYEALYDTATSGGTTLLQWAAQNAGVVGLGMLAVLLWRLLGLAERTARRVEDRAIQAVCLGIGALAVASTIVSDVLLVGAEGTLLVGWLLHVASRRVEPSIGRAEDGGALIPRPLRIVRVIARLNIGGPARHVTLLEQHLATRGYRSWLVYGTPPSGEGELPFQAGLDHEVVRVESLSRSIRFAGDVAAFFRIWRVIREVQPDIVHTHTAKAGALGRVAAACHNATRSRARRAVVVHTFHGHVFEGYFGRRGSAVVRAVERQLARVTDRIVAISEGQRLDLVERFRIAPANRVVVVPLGLDLEPLAAIPADRAPGPSDDTVVCAFVGRLTRVKRVDLLIRACARAFAASPRGRLLIAGDGECRSDLEVLAAEVGLGHRVRFAGWQQDLPALYAGVDVVALSSANEGTPVAVIEAMAAGRAVVATAVGGVPDVIDDGRTGRLVACGDEAALAAAIAQLVADAGQRARLGAAARADAQARFGYARLVVDVDRLYRSTIAAVRGSQA